MWVWETGPGGKSLVQGPGLFTCTCAWRVHVRLCARVCAHTPTRRPEASRGRTCTPFAGHRAAPWRGPSAPRALPWGRCEGSAPAPHPPWLGEDPDHWWAALSSTGCGDKKGLSWGEIAGVQGPKTWDAGRSGRPTDAPRSTGRPCAQPSVLEPAPSRPPRCGGGDFRTNPGPSHAVGADVGNCTVWQHEEAADRCRELPA